MPEPPSHQDIERWVELQPKDVFSRLPDCPETREAQRLVAEAGRLAHRAREMRRD